VLPEERRERRELVAQKLFIGHARSFMVVNVFLIGVWLLAGGGYFWPAWVLLSWGVALVFHGLATFARPRRS